MSDNTKPVAMSLEEAKYVALVTLSMLDMLSAGDDIFRSHGAMSTIIQVFVRRMLRNGVTPEKMRETIAKYIDGANEKPVGWVMLPPDLMAERGIKSGDLLYKHEPDEEYAVAVKDDEAAP